MEVVHSFSESSSYFVSFAGAEEIKEQLLRVLLIGVGLAAVVFTIIMIVVHTNNRIILLLEVVLNKL